MANKLRSEHKAVLLSEDEWLSKIYPDEISTIDDYIKYSARLRPLLKAHIQNLLLAGVSIVLDFPANTKRLRAWFKEIYAEHELPHQLHYIEASNDLCLRQLLKRNEGKPKGTAFTSEEEFYAINRFFEAPMEEEGFNIRVYGREKG